MEENEDTESAKEEVKLGKLQFSMDYDFQKSEVRRRLLKICKNDSSFHTVDRIVLYVILRAMQRNVGSRKDEASWHSCDKSA